MTHNVKILHLNENPNLWLRKARGFKLALELCLKEWSFGLEKYNVIGGNLEETTIIMEPMRHLFFTSIEFYLRFYLHSKGKTWKETKKIMSDKKRHHQLSLLLDECVKIDAKFKDKELQYIHYLAGSTKNYGGARYPESGASASFFDLKILEKLDSIVK